MYKINYEYYPSFSSNVNFVYQISSGKFLFIDGDILNFFNTDQLSSESLIKFVFRDDLSVLEKSYKELLSNQFNGDIKFRIEVNGQRPWFSVTPFVYSNQEDVLICGTLTDISAEVENMEAIKKYANKKNSILHMLAHDLRGPLNIANSLMKSVDNSITDPIDLSKTASISGILKQAIELIENLTEREFLDAVDVALVKQRIDIGLKLQEYIEECKRSSAIANRNFHYTKPDHPLLLSLDESKFMQIVNNLMTNALKFTEDGGNVYITISEDKEAVHLIFEDDGIGIPYDLIPHIFDEYTTASRPGRRGEKSTGLGLFIVRTIIDWHQGTIRCESEEEKGTRFFIKFPKLDH